MRFFTRLVLALLLIAFGSAGGFLAATKYRAQFDALAGRFMVVGGARSTSGSKIIYYRNPMGEPDISATPKKIPWEWIICRFTPTTFPLTA